MIVRLFDHKTQQIVFEGDPNEDRDKFREASKLFPEATIQDLRPEPPPPPPAREGVYVGAAIWIAVAILFAAVVIGFAVRIFGWIVGL